MNTVVDPFAGMRKFRSLADDTLSGMGTGRPAHISRRGNRFTLIDAAGNSKPMKLMDDKGNVYIDLIIVDINKHTSRLYFEQGFSDNEVSPPACFSDNGVGPSVNAGKPQSPVCAGCPQAEWGSAVSKLTGQGIPACQSFKKVAALVVGDDNGLIYEFTITAGSWGDKESGWRWYVGSIQSAMIGNRRAELFDVVTRVSFAPDRMGILQFEPVGQITPEQAQMVLEAQGHTDAIVGRLDKPRDASVPVAPRPQAIATPEPKQQLAPPAAPVAPAKRGPKPKNAEPVVEDIPDFLRRPAATATAPQKAPSTTVDAGLQQALKDAFSLDT